MGPSGQDTGLFLNWSTDGHGWQRNKTKPILCQRNEKRADNLFEVKMSNRQWGEVLSPSIETVGFGFL